MYEISRGMCNKAITITLHKRYKTSGEWCRNTTCNPGLDVLWLPLGPLMPLPYLPPPPPAACFPHIPSQTRMHDRGGVTDRQEDLHPRRQSDGQRDSLIDRPRQTHMQGDKHPRRQSHGRTDSLIDRRTHRHTCRHTDRANDGLTDRD